MGRKRKKMKKKNRRLLLAQIPTPWQFLDINPKISHHYK
jgi:hypothetical protein